jgi:sugar lactone lactonase YvrE
VAALTLTDPSDVLAVVLDLRVNLWDPEENVRLDEIFRLDGWPKVRLNDARADPHGRLWMGSMRNNVNADLPAKRVGRMAPC